MFKFLLVSLMTLSFISMGCQNSLVPNDEIKYLTGDPSFDDRFNSENDNLLRIAEKSSLEAETMAVQTEKALSSMSVDIEINDSDISIFKIGKLKDKLNNIGDNLNTSFQKMNLNIDSVRDRIDTIKGDLQSKIDSLDPSNPVHKELIEKAQNVLMKLDFVQLKIDVILDKFKGLLDKVSVKLDGLISKVTSKLGLLGIPVELILSEIKNNLIEKLKSELLAKIGI